MVKELNISNIHKVYTSKDGLSQNFSLKSLILYFLVLVIAIAILIGARSEALYGNVLSDMLTSLFAMPIIYLILFSIFYVFISAFEDKHKQSFWKSYLTLGIPILTFTLLMHATILLNTIIYNNIFELVLGIINLVITVYFFTIIILNIKSFFSTTYPKVFASVLLMFMINLVLVIIIRSLNA